MQKITPFLWYDHQAEDAAKYYVTVFKNSKITKISHYPKSAENDSGQKAGTVMTVEFELDGQQFVALNGGPHFQFSPAISFSVGCKDQAELDAIWDKLSADPASEQCGWCKDKFGLSWQIVPEEMGKLVGDPAKSDKVMNEVMKMKKLDIAKLKQVA